MPLFWWEGNGCGTEYMLLAIWAWRLDADDRARISDEYGSVMEQLWAEYTGLA